MKRDIDQEVEKLEKSEEVARIEEGKMEQTYADLKSISSSLRIHKGNVHNAWFQV